MALLVGVLLALSVGILATAVGLDRDRSFYPTITTVIASYYALFAVMGGSGHALLAESVAAAVFLVIAAAGFRSSLWLVVIALVAHGVFDFVHDAIVVNRGVPGWWPQFCLAYDVTAAGYLAWLLKRGRLHAAILPR